MAEKYNEDQSRRGAEDGAQIYQEKKGLPIWLWPLLALLLLGLLFALLHGRHGNDQAQTAPPPAQTAPAPAPAPAPVAAAGTDAAAPAGGTDTSGKDIKVHSGTDVATAKPGQASVPGVPLSDVVVFATAADATTFIGRKAKLTNVPVQKVITDRAFFVGPSADQQMLVLLDKGMDAGASGAKKVQIATGQPVSLIGVVEALPTQEAVNQTYGVSAADYTALQSQKAYLHATVAQQK
jgi:hypothetical protein